MKKAGALDAMLNFCRRELPDSLVRAAEAHTGATCVLTGLSPAEVMAKLGPEVNGMMFTCVAEDMLSQPDGPDGMTIAAYFLKRHGWKLTSQEREQLHMIADSVMGLYEVTQLRPGQGLTLQNLLLDEPEIDITKPDIADQLPIGSLLAARLMHFEDGITILSAGVLPFEPKLRDASVNYLREAAELGDRPFVAGDIRKLAPHFTDLWLSKALAEQGVAMSEPAEED